LTECYFCLKLPEPVHSQNVVHLKTGESMHEKEVLQFPGSFTVVNQDVDGKNLEADQKWTRCAGTVPSYLYNKPAGEMPYRLSSQPDTIIGLSLDDIQTAINPK